MMMVFIYVHWVEWVFFWSANETELETPYHIYQATIFWKICESCGSESISKLLPFLATLQNSMPYLHIAVKETEFSNVTLNDKGFDESTWIICIAPGDRMKLRC